MDIETLKTYLLESIKGNTSPTELVSIGMKELYKIKEMSGADKKLLLINALKEISAMDKLSPENLNLLRSLIYSPIIDDIIQMVNNISKNPIHLIEDGVKLVEDVKVQMKVCIPIIDIIKVLFKKK